MNLRYFKTTFEADFRLGTLFVNKILHILRNEPDLAYSSNGKLLVNGLWYFVWVDSLINFVTFTVFYVCFCINQVYCPTIEKAIKFIGPVWYLTLILLSRIFMYAAYITLVLGFIGSSKYKRLQYFKNPLKVIDTILFILFIPLNMHWYLREQTQEYKIEEYELVSFGVSLYIGLGGFRNLTYFGAIDSIRYLVSMLIRVFIDFLPFLAVLGLSIFGFTVLETQTSKSLLLPDETDVY